MSAPRPSAIAPVAAVSSLLALGAARALPGAASSASRASPSLSAAPPPPALGSATPLGPAPGSETCREHVPAGKDRPKLTEKFPTRGTSGHALTLSLLLEHGKGETVLPGGFQPQGDSPEWRALERAGLFVPDPDGGAGPLLERKEQGERATTRLEITFVPLPPKPGRNVILLPSLPISVARASGDVLVLCTEPHQVTLEDPIANVSNPNPKLNPPPRAQREEWTLLKQAVLGAAIALPAGALIAWLLGRWLRRPRPALPPPPPRPPWEVALEELFDVRHAGLIAEARFAEHFDRVSDIVRKYLGARYGFDGLESTTREALGVLRKTTPRIGPLDTIETFLRQADLVKFAKTVPSADDGELALVRAEHIVRQTLPTVAVPALDPGTPEISAAPAAAVTNGAATPPPDSSAEEWGPKPRGSAGEGP